MQTACAILVAVSPDNVIGIGKRIPWRYKGDLARLKTLTMGTTVVMGRVTWESIGERPLPGRRNLVVTSGTRPGVECFRDVRCALESSSGMVWLLGGARVYEEGMSYADWIDVTYVPDRVDGPDAVRFPPIDPSVFVAGPMLVHETEPALLRRIFTRLPAMRSTTSSP
jgi:dihydrofolate reductase